MAAAPAEDVEDPRWRRSSTDCVLFLAAPFACTKGLNCEYRHCEGARFNRRNCWYWFQGNCFNPSCTFRHPPLESFNRTKTLSDQLLSNASASIKTANPCYFYYNSHCKKADNCPFLHVPRTCNDVGICSEATTSSLAVNGNSAGDEMIESSKGALANPCQGSPDHIKRHHSERVSVSSSPEFNGAISNAAETSVGTVGYMKSSRPSYQTSGDSEVEHAEQDECSDSSSGFDVLVDDGVSNKIDLEHPLAQERDPEVLHMKYYIGDPVVYGLDYHDAEYHEQEHCGFDDPRGCYVDYLEGVQGHDCVTVLGDIPHDGMLVKSTSEECGKRYFDPRNLMGSDAVFDHQHTQIGRISKRRPDKRKVAKGKSGCIKRHHVHEPRNDSEEIETRPTHGMQYSLMGNSSRSVCATFRGEKKRSRRKQHNVRSAKSSKYATANVKHLDDPEHFTGPKTFAQIKEEKCRSKSSFSHPAVRVPHGRSFSNDFEGPKSLSELLKAKGRTSVDNGIML